MQRPVANLKIGSEFQQGFPLANKPIILQTDLKANSKAKPKMGAVNCQY
jgi:hypothetical protein